MRFITFVCTILLLLYSVSAQSVFAAPGELDTSFGSDGVTLVNFRTGVNAFAEARGVAVQADGKVVVAGDYYEGVNTHVALVRYTAAGAVDTSFGSGGIVQLPLFGYEYVEDVALQPDGKIVVAGWNDQSGNNCFVARFNSNGTIDSGFGASGSGYTTVEFGNAGSQDRCYAVRIDSANRIVMSGYGQFGSPSQNNAAIARFTSTGALDSSFGTGGKTSYNINPSGSERVYGMALQSDDKIVIAGKDNTLAQAYVARFNINGSLDTGFNSPNGFVKVSLGGTSDEFRAVALQPDGKIVAGGGAYLIVDGSGNRAMKAALARFNSNGTLDSTFDSDGIASVPVSSNPGTNEIFDVRVYNAGAGGYKILASGYSSTDWLYEDWDFFGMRVNANGSLDAGWGTGGKTVVDMSGGSDDWAQANALGVNGELFVGGYAGSGGGNLIALLKLNSSGQADTTFNSNGKVFTQLQAGSNDQSGLVVMQSDGKVILAGATQNNNWDIGVARLTSSGVLDTTFNSTGSTTYGNADTSVYEYPSAVGVQNDGKILVAATIGTGFGILRYNVNGTLDPGFGTGGIATVSLGANGGTLNGIAVQSDGKIIAAGTNQATPSDSHAVVMRFNTNGTLDTTFGSSGKSEWDYPGSTGFDEIAAVYLQTDGRIIVSGRFSAGTYFHGGVARLTTTGALDTTFGSSGKATFSLNSPDGTTEFYGIGVQLDGKIILAGKVTPASSTNDSLVARLNTDGSLDTAFGGAGYAVVPLSSGNDQATRALVRWDDKIVMVGSAFNGSNDDLGVAMLNQNGELDTTFTPTGKLLTPIGARNDYITGFTIQQDGKWLIGGSNDAASDLLALRMIAPPHDPRNVVLEASSDTGRSDSDRITRDNTPAFAGECFNYETVHLQIDGSDIAQTVTCSAGFTFTLTASTIPDGTHSVRAYSSTAEGNSAVSPEITVVIDTVALPPSITAPVEGGAVAPDTTLSGAAEPDADVVVYEGAPTLCSTRADASGNWSCAVNLSVGSHTIYAKQTDVAGNTSAASSNVTFIVKWPTTTVVNSAPNPSTYKNSVSFTATVDTVPAGQNVPGGTVTFKSNGTAFAGPLALTGGTASASTAAFNAGVYAITVDYSGDALDMASTSDSFNHVVQKADQTITFNPLADKTAGAASFGISATSDSNLTVSFNSLSTSVCNVAGTTVTLTNLAGACSIRATQGGDSNYNAATPVDRSFTVNPGPAAVFELSAPASATAGSPFSVTATARDAYSNTATGYAGTARFTSDDAQAVLPADSTLTSGVGTFPVTLKTAGSRSVTATDSANPTITGSGNITVNATTATKLLFATEPGDATAGSVFGTQPVIRTQDAYGNDSTVGLGNDINATITLTSGTGPLQGTVAINIGNNGATPGTATYTNLRIDIASDEKQLTAWAPGFDAAVSTTFDVAPATSSSFTITAPPSATAGAAFNITVTSRDAFGNTTPDYDGTVHFTSSDSQAGLPGDSILTNGTGAFEVTLKTAGFASITATDTATVSITGNGDVTVDPDVAVVFSVSGPASTIAGDAFTITVTARDAFNNTSTGYVGTVHFTSDDDQGMLPSDYTFVELDSGSKTFVGGVTLKTAGSMTVTATDAATPSITGTSGSIDVVPASVVALSVTAPAITTAGEALDITVTAEDTFNNTVTGYAGTVRFTSTDAQSSLPSDYTFVSADNGSKTFAAETILRTAGSMTVTATDAATPSIAGTSGSINVGHASVTKLSVAAPAIATAGNAIDVTVSAQDPFDNTVTGYAGTVHFTSTDAQSSLPSDYTFVSADSGNRTFTGETILKTAGSVTVTARDAAIPSIAGTTGSIAVNEGALAKFSFAAIGSPETALIPFTVTISAEDEFNNVVAGFTGTADLSVSPGSSISPAMTGSFASGIWSGSVTVSGGGNGITINAKNTSGLESGTSNPFDVEKNPQSIVVTTSAPGSAIYNANFTVAATGGASGQPVTYGSSGVCSNAGATFTMTSGTGTCTVHYNQTGDSNYNSAGEITENVNAQRTDQTITVTMHAPASAENNSSFTVAAASTSGLPVGITASGFCSGSGTTSATITMTGGTGTCMVHYSQTGNGNYNAAPELVETVTALYPTHVVIPAATGNGTIVLDTSSPGCRFMSYSVRTEQQVENDATCDYPYGLVEFTLTCASADVTITFPGSLTGMTYRKYGPTTPGNAETEKWYTFANAEIEGNSVTLHLTDGQLGDDTGVDGIIVDQGGPGQRAAVPIPATNTYGLMLFTLFAFLASAYLLRKRKEA